MPKWWKIGFVSVLLVTTGASSAHVAMREPALETGAVQASSYPEDNGLDWNWGPEDQPCEIYETCQIIEVFETARCSKQIEIELHLEDAKEQWVDAVPMVILSPMNSEPALIEIGVDRTDFEYFAIGEVRCTASAPTVEATL